MIGVESNRIVNFDGHRSFYRYNPTDAADKLSSVTWTQIRIKFVNAAWDHSPNFQQADPHRATTRDNVYRTLRKKVAVSTCIGQQRKFHVDNLKTSQQTRRRRQRKIIQSPRESLPIPHYAVTICHSRGLLGCHVARDLLGYDWSYHGEYMANTDMETCTDKQIAR